MKNAVHRSRLGAALRELRRQKGWTLADVSRRTGVSVPSLSRIENDRLSLSYDKLIRVSEGLEVDITQLFARAQAAVPPAAITGRRSVTPRGQGELVATRNYNDRYLSTDVTRKKLIPILSEAKSHSMEEFGALVRHAGEEFVHVLEGELEVHTELYAPFELGVGDSAYIDSTMGHAYLAKGVRPCRFLVICSASEHELREAMMDNGASAVHRETGSTRLARAARRSSRKSTARG